MDVTKRSINLLRYKNIAAAELVIKGKHDGWTDLFDTSEYHVRNDIRISSNLLRWTELMKFISDHLSTGNVEPSFVLGIRRCHYPVITS